MKQKKHAATGQPGYDKLHQITPSPYCTILRGCLRKVHRGEKQGFILHVRRVYSCSFVSKDLYV